jgi:hypothetical protein
MLPGAHDSEGRLYGILSAPPDGSARLGGVALSALSQVYVTETLPISGSTQNGYRFDSSGSIFAQPTGVATTYVGGIPLNELGAVLIDKVGTPVATDPWVAGTRVGPNGVYVNMGTPPSPNAFSSGFNVGYGA